MSWWRRLFSHGKSRSTFPIRNDLISSVIVSIPGWHEETPTDTMRNWHHPSGAALTLATTTRSDTPSLSHLGSLRDSFRRIAEGNGAALVEADVVQSAYGPSARMIYKKPQGMGFLFTGMLLLPADDQWLVCTVVDAEKGMTGVREAVVTTQLMEAGQLTIESYQESWARDPYDPEYSPGDRRGLRYLSDDECYDSQFPEHPLSNVRNVLKALLENVFVES